MESVHAKRSGFRPSKFVNRGYAIESFLRFVPDKTARVLDLGSGTGFFLEQLREGGYDHLSGVDIHIYGTPPFEIKRADVSYEKLPWPGGHFDAVTAWEVFEHLENPHLLMREIHRVLTPGGILLLSMPNVSHLESRWMFLKGGELRRWNDENDHLGVFTHSIFKKTFLKYFILLERIYYSPVLAKEGFFGAVRHKMKFVDRLLPANEWFGYFVVYALKNHP